ncbi:MAG: glycosyltransferase family 2 protein [Phycisphaerae bacterium]|nr:glycosyltransferase family 2 protein [Phycisphaerae bacterium]
MSHHTAIAQVTPGDCDAGAERPTVSVIIPTYNSAATLPDAIESVLNQTYAPDEIIIVDDGSTDDTQGVCRRFPESVRCIRQENAGASVARNSGAAASCGDLLAFLDADDVWEPQKLELQVTAMLQNPEATFVLSAVLSWSRRENQYYKYEWTGSLDPRTLRRELLVRNIFTGLCSSILIRRDAFEAIAGFAPGKLSEDRRLAIDLLARFQGLILPHALVRQRPGPASFGNPETMRQAMIEFINDYLALFHELDRSGRLLRRARARVHERAGMHYLEKGNRLAAAADLARAAAIWPFMANPWRFFANACMGRLNRFDRAAKPPSTPIAAGIPTGVSGA